MSKARFGHVEAGLRTEEKFDPFPEEMNRRMTTRLTDFHYAPDAALSRENLLREGVSDADIRVTGNTVVDALREVAAREYTFSTTWLSAEFVNRPGRLILVTMHRRENWGAPMIQREPGHQKIGRIVPRRPRIVFPMHKNPDRARRRASPARRSRTDSA